MRNKHPCIKISNYRHLVRGFFGKIRLKIGLANTKKVCYALKKLRGLTVGVNLREPRLPSVIIA